jgi:hypothetical protein
MHVVSAYPTLPSPSQVLLVLHLADAQKASGQQLASWNYAQDMAAQNAKTTAGRTEGAGGETSMPQVGAAVQQFSLLGWLCRSKCVAPTHLPPSYMWDCT